MAFVTVADISSALRKELEAHAQEEAERCANAASDWVNAWGRVVEQATKSVVLNGCDAVGKGGELLWLPSSWRQVKHATPDFVTVTEDGVSLSVATGYSLTAGCIVMNANSDEAVPVLRRNGSQWSSDYQNVAVTAKVGWASNAIPARVKQLGVEVAILFLRTPTWIGKASVSKAGAAVSFLNELSEQSKATLEWLRVF